MHAIVCAPLTRWLSSAKGSIRKCALLMQPSTTILHKGFWWGIGWPEMRIGQVSLTSSCPEKGIWIYPLHKLNQYGPRQEGYVIIKTVEKVLFLFYILKQREYILGKKYVWDGKLHEWQLMVWASRNSHHCVGKQVWYLYTSACVRVQTCVLWPLNIIYLHLRGGKNILRY